jgi:hypothetical protein
MIGKSSKGDRYVKCIQDMIGKSSKGDRYVKCKVARCPASFILSSY